MPDKKSFVTIANHSREKLMYLLTMAAEFEKFPNRKILEGKVVATLFLNLQPVHVSHLKQPPTD